MLPENLGHLFDIPLRLTPDAVAVIQDETTLTYRRLEERVCRMANVLVGLGVGGGDRVALMFGNDWRFLEAFFAPMRLGAVSVPLNIRMGDEALAYVLEDAEANVLIAGRDQGARARTLAGQAKALGHLLVDGPEGDYAPRMEAASPRFRRRRVDPEAVCMQPYTSGSTGRPKGVLLALRGRSGTPT
jgi:acyl-coenzyme A synthetase/AMP-(fatty) acid ligase